MQILVTAASQRLNITDPMTVEEFTNADTMYKVTQVLFCDS